MLSFHVPQLKKVQSFDQVLWLFLSDGIHLTNEGSKIVSKEILNVLKEAEWEPSLYWKSMPSEFGEDSPYDVVGPDGKTTYNLSNFIYPDNDMWD